jgi:lipopolysaccharide/colanic/teichoic acid biosynthesis glycosyltransferase
MANHDEIPASMNAHENNRIPRWKRALDVVTILLAMPCLLPLSVVIAAVIRATSTGPILFKQERVGYYGRRFMCLKFRTMYCAAEPVVHQSHLKNLMDSNAPMEKLDARGDSRITPAGKWLRASGLDELPQLLNVLRGEMSLVGPRPCLPYEAEKFLPWQQERFNATPGLTGLWQVSGKNRTTFTRMIQLDIEYARNLSLLLDLKIILKTAPALLAQMSDSRQRKHTLSSEAGFSRRDNCTRNTTKFATANAKT